MKEKNTAPKKPRSRKEMIDCLKKHFRYDTMNPWNRSTSYARCVKIHRIDFPSREVENRAYDFLDIKEAYSDIRRLMREFAERYDHRWQMGFNGRSGGYLVLYQGGKKDSGYKSECLNCGQLNYKHAPEDVSDDPERMVRRYIRMHNHWTPDVYPSQSEIKALGLPNEKVIEIVMDEKAKIKSGISHETSVDNECGKCGENARVNLETPVFSVFTQPGKGVDMEEDFEDWDTDSLRDRVNLVWDFDRAVDKCIEAFVDFVSSHVVEEKEVPCVKTVRVAAKKAA